MSTEQSQWCVFLPCASDQVWAVPQNCLAEIVSVADAGQTPPSEISWRGQQVPVLDLESDSAAPWVERSGETGLLAVILGLKDEGCDYWAVALRGEGLGMKDVLTEELQDCPDEALPRSVGAFRMGGSLYQVPDLLELQRGVSDSAASAA